MKKNKILKEDKHTINIKEVEMAKKSAINLRFLKINYLNNLFYYTKDKIPKEVFNQRIINFFKENYESHSIFNFDGMEYCFGGIEITDKYIFGKLWKLKKKIDKDFPWNGKDYEPKNQMGEDYHFSYFYIDMNTKHLVVQDERELIVERFVEIISSWFDSFHNVKDGINFKYLNSKKDFIKELEGAYKVISAKFVVYPSNLDFDSISKPLDDEMHNLGISEIKQEIKSNEGVKLNLEKPNIFSSSLAQAMRGNGEIPEVKTQNKNGSITLLSKKIKHIKKQIQSIKDLNNSPEIKKLLINELKDVLKNLSEENGI